MVFQGESGEFYLTGCCHQLFCVELHRKGVSVNKRYVGLKPLKNLVRLFCGSLCLCPRLLLRLITIRVRTL